MTGPAPLIPAPSPLPLGLRAPITVALRELGGKVVTVRRVNGRTIRLLQQWKADAAEDLALAWTTAAAMIDGGLTPEELELLELDSVMKIIWLASAEVAEVERVLSKGEGPATAP